MVQAKSITITDATKIDQFNFRTFELLAYLVTTPLIHFFLAIILGCTCHFSHIQDGVNRFSRTQSEVGMRLKYLVLSATTPTVVSEPIANAVATSGVAKFSKLRSGTYRLRDL